MTPLYENEDINAVPGSTGPAGVFFVEWAPRATTASDRARREAMAALAPILSKHRPNTPIRRAPMRSASFNAARAQFFGE